MQTKNLKHIKKIVLIGIFAALLTGGKMAIAVIPNVEIVTILLSIYTIVFGLSVALPVAIIFVTVEILIFGFAPWVIAYYIYWPLLVVIMWLFKRLFKDKNIVYIITAILLTAFFGVLTSFVDTLFLAGSADTNFFAVFAAIYLRGIWFYVTHIVANAIIFSLLLIPLKALAIKLNENYFAENKKCTKND